MALRTERQMYVSASIPMPEGEELNLFDFICPNDASPEYLLLQREAEEAGYDDVEIYLAH